VACTGTLAYTGSESAYVAGYLLGAFSGGLLAPAVGAMLAELFPTSVRASVTGWWVTAGVLGAVVGLVAFGAVADVGNRFAAAAELTFLPAAAAAALFWFLPETKGREPEALWPDPDPGLAPG
jgi:MFS family permease